MATSSSVEPAMFGGRGKDLLAPSDMSGGLAGKSFSSRSPPDIQPNTRIIALCGIADYQGADTEEISSEEEAPSKPTFKKKAGTLMEKGKELFTTTKGKERRAERKDSKQKPGKAAPVNDGWFFSDFFLFWHLFKGLGSNQIWMTCESPADLVRYYREYAHGDPSKDHRVVLNKDMLKPMAEANNIRKTERGDLLERFLATFKDECKAAEQLQQPVLLLLFGHGDPNTYGIAIGGDKEPKRAPRLYARHIVGALRGINVELSLIMTSCYSGGWLLQPGLNISALTVVGSNRQSSSWKFSLGGRAHGSSYTTAVREAFIRMEDESATQFNPYRQGHTIGSGPDSTSYAELTKVIYKTLLNDIDINGREYKISFAAQDDQWELEWRKRSGIPLGQFQSRWDALPRLPPQEGTGTTSFAGSSKNPSYGSLGFHNKFSTDQAKMALKDLARGYLNSHPTDPTVPKAKDSYAMCQQLLHDRPIYRGQMNSLRAALTYRMNGITTATRYKDICALTFPDCHEFDPAAWRVRTQAGMGPKARTTFSPLEKVFDECSDMIRSSNIFDPPTDDEGWEDTKPMYYLAAAFAESRRSRADIEVFLTFIADCKSTRMQMFLCLGHII
ncbi:MAG: hypothetical protein Q9221_001364 [Calogaya cf. arnoldii]